MNARFQKRPELRAQLRAGGSLADPARAAGVSYLTLTSILSGRSGGSPETWARIQRVIRAREGATP